MLIKKWSRGMTVLIFAMVITKIRHQNLQLESRIQVGFGEPEELN
jgi:hypothetical protein